MNFSRLCHAHVNLLISHPSHYSSWACGSLLPLFLPHLHLQSLPSCQPAVPKLMGVVAAGLCVPGKIIFDWLPGLLLLLWHAEKMLMGPNVFDTEGETASSRHGAFCHPFSSCTGWSLPVQFCLLKRTWPGAFRFDRSQGLKLPCGKKLKQCHLLADGYTKRELFCKDKFGILAGTAEVDVGRSEAG